MRYYFELTGETGRQALFKFIDGLDVYKDEHLGILMNGQNIEMELKRRFYFAWLLPSMVKKMQLENINFELKSGQEAEPTTQALHRFIETMFLSNTDYIHPTVGCVENVPFDLSDIPLDRSESIGTFSDFVHKIRVFVLNRWGIDIPKPQGEILELAKRLNIEWAPHGD